MSTAVGWINVIDTGALSRSSISTPKGVGEALDRMFRGGVHAQERDGGLRNLAAQVDESSHRPRRPGFAIDGTVLKMASGKLLHLVADDPARPDRDSISRDGEPVDAGRAPDVSAWPMGSAAGMYARARRPSTTMIATFLGLLGLLTASTPDYRLGMLSDRPQGRPDGPPKSWRASIPMRCSPVKIDSKVYGPGHNSFFQSPDGKEDWIAYHAKTGTARTYRRSHWRSAQRFTWNPDGTPHFGKPLPLDAEIKEPSGETWRSGNQSSDHRSPALTSLTTTTFAPFKSRYRAAELRTHAAAS